MADRAERKGFSLDTTTGTLSALDASDGNYWPLADYIDISGAPCNGTMFTYRDKNGNSGNRRCDQ